MRAVARVGLDPEGRVAFKRAGRRSLPYPDGLFDLVVQAGGPLRPRELARVLGAGGLLLLIGRRRLAELAAGAARLRPGRERRGRRRAVSARAPRPRG